MKRATLRIWVPVWRSSMSAREQIGRFKYVEEAKIQEQYEAILADMTAEFDEIAQKEEQLA